MSAVDTGLIVLNVLQSDQSDARDNPLSASKSLVVVHCFFTNPKDDKLICDDLEFDCDYSTNLRSLQGLAIGSTAPA